LVAVKVDELAESKAVEWAVKKADNLAERKVARMADKLV
jgi:hypothetical protein